MIPFILRPMWGFIFRDYHLTRRYLSWTIVFLFYSLVSAATVALIGLAANDYRLILRLSSGVLLWSFLGSMYNQIANSISYERWEGTLEYTFMAPVSRLTHLAGVSLFAVMFSLLQTFLVLGGLLLFVPLTLSGANLWGILLVVLVASVAFTGLGLMAAVLPVLSPEHGAQATNIFQGVLLLVSGVYYPISVLPSWLQPLSVISPGTYALSATRKLLGVDNPASTSAHLVASTSAHLVASRISDVLPELAILTLMGLAFIPLGLYVFSLGERWAKRTGKLKRTG